MAMDGEAYEMTDAGEMRVAGGTDATGGARDDGPSLDATKRRVLEAASAGRERETPVSPASEGDTERAGKSSDGTWDAVTALIEAMEAGHATALRGRDIRMLRKAVKMSARELAKRLGYTESAIYDWETERHFCPPNRYLALLDAILGWREEQEHWMALIHKDVRALQRRQE